MKTVSLLVIEMGSDLIQDQPRVYPKASVSLIKFYQANFAQWGKKAKIWCIGHFVSAANPAER